MGDRVADKVVFLAGGGSAGPGWGIGKACAALYAREGAAVFVVDRDEVAARETVRVITEEGGRALAGIGDLTSPDDVERLVAECRDRLGGLHVLHNNVAITRVGGPAELSLEDWDASWRTNVTSMFLACKYALPIMERDGGGAVVNIASVAASRYLGVPYTAYYTTKAAVVQFTKVVAVQYATRGIRSNAVSPCFVTGPNSNQFLEEHGADPDIQRFSGRRAEQAPMQRVATGFDVAYAALYLASDEANYVTGTELIVDGGVSAQAVF
ncbi:NAD(P)-dependent dehydrogenase, short-chain alcohol dehydrogenase family [Faunimonas pinastri]|uniref:NAD(P)-dependent dehydrogenase, short-chain alcohol dehydrogenase family n=1 Tax=Faunimonas pinastri TaxID=1855383 RepID=A0A1H9EBI0_9HYPH|nr:SDR family oxidoreductase [Faunimonas pinastri]SEQ22892.1 NAD(P)-dependent dehydrogenase, short-chain alcohol dehydrogenase family [Faunimonas pinastri]